MQVNTPGQTINVECIAKDPRIGSDPKFSLPEYKTAGAAAMDLVACLDAPLTLQPGENTLINSGIAVHIKDPHIGLFLLPRSGLGHKHRICLANGTGLIDSDYTGEIKISLFNNGKAPFTVEPGERICQAVFMPIIRAELIQVTEFTSVTDRGAGGFGSTGR